MPSNALILWLYPNYVVTQRYPFPRDEIYDSVAYFRLQSVFLAINCNLLRANEAVPHSAHTKFILFYRETEADRQIREIMGRVMKHANAVLGDIGMCSSLVCLGESKYNLAHLDILCWWGGVGPSHI